MEALRTRGCCHSASVSASGVLPLFAVSAIPGPGDCFQARFVNRLPTFFTDPKSTLAKPLKASSMARKSLLSGCFRRFYTVALVSPAAKSTGSP